MRLENSRAVCCLDYVPGDIECSCGTMKKMCDCFIIWEKSKQLSQTIKNYSSKKSLADGAMILKKMEYLAGIISCNILDGITETMNLQYVNNMGTAMDAAVSFQGLCITAHESEVIDCDEMLFTMSAITEICDMLIEKLTAD